MKVKFKKLHPDAVIPSYAKPGDAGLDLTAVSDSESNGDGTLTYRTGLSVEIPEGYVGLIFPRSSISKTPLLLANSVGVVDSGYRGEMFFKFKANVPVGKGETAVSYRRRLYKKGDRIGQLVIIPFPAIEPEEAGELSDSERGEGGFGSTGS